MIRLFVALDLPATVRNALVNWQRDQFGAVPGLRLIEPSSLHATLCFLGSRAEEEVDAIGAACALAAGPALEELSVGDALWLPERGRPRVAAVSVMDHGGGLASLQSSLADALSAGGWYARETRPFRAHVTVARVSKSARVHRNELASPHPVRFAAQTVTLYRSLLGSGGARYEPVRVFELGAAAVLADPVAVVRRFHVEQAEVYAGRSVERLGAWLSPDVVWHVPGRSAIAGEHRGIDAVLAYFELRRRMTDETFRVAVHGVAEIGDRVVQLAGGSAVREGRSISWETVGVFRVAGGRIAECWLMPFDLEEFDRAWG